MWIGPDIPARASSHEALNLRLIVFGLFRNHSDLVRHNKSLFAH
jgi:hypothetical protein